MPARYVGTPTVTLLSDGRLVRLENDFSFIDADGMEWPVPSGAKVDGASIPPLFWPIIGSPFTGKFRDASIIHDWYCDRRTRTWQSTHRVFYNAMRVSQVPEIKAKSMYFAVCWKGPRWEEKTVFNNTLNRFSGSTNLGFVARSQPISRKIQVNIDSPGSSTSTEVQKFVSEQIEAYLSDKSIEEIDALVENFDPDSLP